MPRLPQQPEHPGKRSAAQQTVSIDNSAGRGDLIRPACFLRQGPAKPLPLQNLPDIRYLCAGPGFRQGIGGLRHIHAPLGLIQFPAHLRFILVGHAAVYFAQHHNIMAVVHLPHGRDAVLAVHHIEFSVTKTHDHRLQQKLVPLGNQLVHIFLPHGPLVGLAGDQPRRMDDLIHARVAIGSLGGTGRQKERVRVVWAGHC